MIGLMSIIERETPMNDDSHRSITSEENVQLQQEIDQARQLLAGLSSYDWLTKSKEQYYKSSEVAAAFRVDKRKVDEWCLTEKIPYPLAIYFGANYGWRISPDGLIIYLARLHARGLQIGQE